MAYFYPYYIPPYRTEVLYSTFPEHHYPLEHTRHKLGELLHHPMPTENGIRTPRVDIRESLSKFYIDIELPGLDSKEAIKLKWTNSRTLLCEARIHRPRVPEEVQHDLEHGDTEPVKEADKDQKKPEHPVHVITGERQIGLFARAFDFPVDVDKEKLEAKLQYGLLCIVAPKKVHEKAGENIPIEHADEPAKEHAA